MQIQSVTSLYFSPTGTTKAIVTAIAKGIAPADARFKDCTHVGDRENLPSFAGADAVILAAPVYYGRLPESIVPVFNALEGAGKPVILVAVYGNREYEDALVELYDISRDRGFIPAAAGAFIGEHSYSVPGRPWADGRPDTIDLDRAEDFGRQIREKLARANSPDDLGSLDIPGNRPYKIPENLYRMKQIRESVPFTPETDSASCTQCNICVDACPEGAIDSCDVTEIDRWKCILCFACVKSCPEQAKNMNEPNFNQAIDQLAQANQARKTPEIFLGGQSVP